MIYETRQFQYEWELVASFQLKSLLYLSVVYYNGLWWKFASDSNFNPFLHYTKDLQAGWPVHPLSLIKSDPAMTPYGG